MGEIDLQHNRGVKIDICTAREAVQCHEQPTAKSLIFYFFFQFSSTLLSHDICVRAVNELHEAVTLFVVRKC